jgi:DnaD/phage-associated family protein
MQEKTVSVNEKGYCTIGKMVIQDKRLNKISKLIYVYLKCFTNKENISFPPKNMICADLNISKNTFEKYIKELVSTGYITIRKNRVGGKFSNNTYYFNENITVTQSAVHYSMGDDSMVSDGIAPDQLTTKSNIYKSNIYKNTTTTLYTNNNIYSGGGSIIDYYKENINSEIKPTEIEELQKWIDKGFEEEVIKECIKVAVKNNRRFLNYIIGILKRLEKQNIKTYTKYLESEKNYTETKGEVQNENASKKLYGNYY